MMLRSLLQVTAAVTALSIIPVATSAMASVDTNSYRELETFMEVYNRVKSDYVDKVDDKTLVDGAIQGMLAALDPHSAFEDGLAFDNLKIQTDGNYGGLYQRSDDEMLAMWRVAVEETRALMQDGWA